MKIDLLDSIRDLKRAGTDFVYARSPSQQEVHDVLAPLQNAITNLGKSKAARPLRSPDECLNHWREYLQGSRTVLESRTVRYLCWEPDIATDPRFYSYLKSSAQDLNARSLQGLIRSCHARWSDLNGDSPIVSYIRDRLERYQGSNRLITNWAQSTSMILGNEGPQNLSEEMLERKSTIRELCEEWFLDEQTAYITKTARCATDRCRERMRKDPTLGRYLIAALLPWQGWSVNDFKVEVAQAILHDISSSDSQFRSSLLKLILNNDRNLLGDPRLPSNFARWAGASEEARMRVVRWLSGGDIIFFFKHVMRDSEDRNGRKKFWLNYVNACHQSRPLLNRADLERLRPQLKKITDYSGSHGFITGGGNSAFLLDFGSVLAIEFNNVGACYIYQKRNIPHIVPDFWTGNPLRETDLKQRYFAVQRVLHNSGWQSELQYILAQYGIRPS